MKRATRRLAGALAVVLPLSLALSLGAAPAQAAQGQRSLAKVLTSDDNKFDRNSNDFDVTTEAVLAVLAAKPDSPVKVLTDGSVRLTAFVPTDRAFRRLVRSLTGKHLRSERKIFNAVAGLGIDTVENVLLYHVVPGATITRRMALRSDGAQLTTALGPTIGVNVLERRRGVRLQDKDTNARNPRIVVFNINKGNKQIAHAINRVLRPLDL